MNTKIAKILESLTEEEQATLAAEILNEIDPTLENMEAFFNKLNDTVHGELISRAEDQENRYE